MRRFLAILAACAMLGGCDNPVVRSRLGHPAMTTEQSQVVADAYQYSRAYENAVVYSAKPIPVLEPGLRMIGCRLDAPSAVWYPAERKLVRYEALEYVWDQGTGICVQAERSREEAPAPSPDRAKALFELEPAASAPDMDMPKSSMPRPKAIPDPLQLE